MLFWGFLIISIANPSLNIKAPIFHHSSDGSLIWFADLSSLLFGSRFRVYGCEV